jgi:hypothetical protein
MTGAERRFLLPEKGDAGSSIAHPRLRQLYELWRAKCAGRPAPLRADFSIEELRPWLGHLMILDCVGEDDFRIFGFDLTGMLVSQATARIGEKPLIEYRQVRALQAPSYVARSSPSSREYLTMDKLALPLMEDGAVNKIMGAIYLSAAR